MLETDCPNKRCHLEMIQSVVERMGNDSFHIKEWAIAIFAAVCTLFSSDSLCSTFIIVLLFLVLWVLDSYYLCLERKFRQLYNCVRLKQENDIDFDMNLKNVTLNMSSINSFNIAKIVFSKSVFPLYLVCIIGTIVLHFIK